MRGCRSQLVVPGDAAAAPVARRPVPRQGNRRLRVIRDGILALRDNARQTDIELEAMVAEMEVEDELHRQNVPQPPALEAAVNQIEISDFSSLSSLSSREDEAVLVRPLKGKGWKGWALQPEDAPDAEVGFQVLKDLSRTRLGRGTRQTAFKYCIM